MIDLICRNEAGIDPAAISNLTYTQYDQVVSGLIQADRNTQWWLGDLLRMGESLYPQEWSQSLSAASDYQVETLIDYARVAAAWPIEHRLSPDILPFNHHREIISTKYGYQDIDTMIEWRDRAVTEMLSIRSLRAALKLSHHAITSSVENPSSDGVVNNMPVEQTLMLDGHIKNGMDVTGDVDFEGGAITVDAAVTLTIVGPARVRVVK